MAAPSAPLDPLTGVSAARFGVYVHFPYCLSKCPYCDFASTVVKEIPEERYTRALLTELKLRIDRTPSLRGRGAQSIFLGGGTPSLWHPRKVAEVLETLARQVGLAAGAEVTLEANPGASDASRFSDFRAAGINRLSIGVQSFEAPTLAALGRAHDGALAEAAYRSARAAGFDNVSLDFIYGVHGQRAEQAESDARRAVALGPEHLSAYALTLEKEALAEEVPLAKQLARGEVVLPPDEEVVEMGHRVRDVYGAAGYTRYEISNYARDGFHSRHNTLYWTGGEYLALGVGATGYLANEGAPHHGVRYTNQRSAEVYLRELEAGRLPTKQDEPLGRDELFAERLAMGLRLASGVDVEAVCATFGEAAAPRRAKIPFLVKHGFAVEKDGRLALTEKGADVHSAICAQLL